MSSFSTTDEIRECADILASCKRISFGELAHRSLCEYTQKILDAEWDGISPQEFLERMRIKKSA